MTTAKKSKYRGNLIVFEGLDCSGKSTQAELFHNMLPNSILCRDPGTTEYGEAVRSMLANLNMPLCGEAQFLQYQSARIQLINEVVIPALNDGKNVICDRFYPSSCAYQHDIYNMKNNYLYSDIIYSQYITVPIDFLVFIDITFEEYKKRLSMRPNNTKQDYMDCTRFDKVRKHYLDWLYLHNDYANITIDAQLDKNEIHKQAMHAYRWR